MTPHEAAEVFALFQQADDYEGVFWRVDMDSPEREMKIFVNCSDIFAWATADAEEVTRDDIPLLRQTLSDLCEVDATYELQPLFAARKRKMRPQKPCYKSFSAAIAALYDACCTDEERAEFDRKDGEFWLSLPARIKAQEGKTSPA